MLIFSEFNFFLYTFHKCEFQGIRNKRSQSLNIQETSLKISRIIYLDRDQI